MKYSLIYWENRKIMVACKNVSIEDLEFHKSLFMKDLEHVGVLYSENPDGKLCIIPLENEAGVTFSKELLKKMSGEL